ncbi:MAG: YceI family protein [Hymenobacteraceae bacterium]|nr:YceI family protein [Hymenobacteraceae bacterium]
MMRNRIFLPALVVALLFVGALAPSAAWAQSGRYMTRYGLTTLFSATPVVDIEARNTKTAAVIDLTTGQVAVSLLMSDFQFERSLMQQHFNESYLETDTYPKAIFTGKFVDYQPGALQPGAKLTVYAKGELSMHGKLRPILAPVWLELKDGRVTGTTRLVISPADYGIEIPLIVRDHIAKVVDVNITLLCDPIPVTLSPTATK